MQSFLPPLLLTGAILSASVSFGGTTVTTQQARGLFERLSGTPVLITDPRLAKITQLIASRNLLEASAIATDDPQFYNVTVKNFSAVMSNHDESVLAPLNDFQATFIGAVRDELDARTLLTGDYVYTPGRNRAAFNSNYYEPSSPENNPDSLLKTLLTQTKVTEAQFGFVPSGLFTTWAWAAAHYDMGTNRRAVEYAFREFLCAPISQWKDPNLPDMNVRRDIDRVPGGDARTFQKQCRTCHAPMDGLAGAFARFDFVNGALVFTGADKVAAKYNQKSQTYPQGYTTFDDSWINRATQHHNVSFGWPTASGGVIRGKRLNEFGSMIANAEGFKSCMVKRVFKTLCHRDAASGEQELITSLSARFGEDKYNLKKLFQRVAIAPQCEFEGTNKRKIIGIKNFNQYFESMRVVTGVNVNQDRDLMTVYRSSMPRLPKEGRIDELTAPVMLTYTSLAGHFCRAYADAFTKAAPKATDQEAVSALALRFWGREPTKNEFAKLSQLSAVAGDKGLIKKTCTVMATSLEFLYN